MLKGEVVLERVYSALGKEGEFVKLEKSLSMEYFWTEMVHRNSYFLKKSGFCVYLGKNESGVEEELFNGVLSVVRVNKKNKPDVLHETKLQESGIISSYFNGGLEARTFNPCGSKIVEMQKEIENSLGTFQSEGEKDYRPEEFGAPVFDERYNKMLILYREDIVDFIVKAILKGSN